MKHLEYIQSIYGIRKEKNPMAASIQIFSQSPEWYSQHRVRVRLPDCSFETDLGYLEALSKIIDKAIEDWTNK